MSDLSRSEAIAWCSDNKCDFKSPVFPPPEGWAWAKEDGALVLEPIFTTTDQGSSIAKNEVWGDL